MGMRTNSWSNKVPTLGTTLFFMERYHDIGAWSRYHHSLYADPDTLVSVRAFDPSQSRPSQAKRQSPPRIILPNRNGEGEVKTGSHRSKHQTQQEEASLKSDKSYSQRSPSSTSQPNPSLSLPQFLFSLAKVWFFEDREEI